MAERIYRLIDATLSRLKGRDYRLDRDVPVGLLAGVIMRRGMWLARGLSRLPSLSHIATPADPLET